MPRKNCAFKVSSEIFATAVWKCLPWVRRSSTRNFAPCWSAARVFPASAESRKKPPHRIRSTRADSSSIPALERYLKAKWAEGRRLNERFEAADPRSAGLPEAGNSFLRPDHAAKG